MAVVEQPVQDRGGDHWITEDLAPFGKALVQGEDHTAPFVPGRDQGKERRGRESVVGPDPNSSMRGPSEPGTRASAGPGDARLERGVGLPGDREPG